MMQHHDSLAWSCLKFWLEVRVARGKHDRNVIDIAGFGTRTSKNMSSSERVHYTGPGSAKTWVGTQSITVTSGPASIISMTQKTKWFRPGSNWGSFACEANGLTNFPTEPVVTVWPLHAVYRKFHQPSSRLCLHLLWVLFINFVYIHKSGKHIWIALTMLKLLRG